MSSRELRLAVWRQYSWVKVVDGADRWQWYSLVKIAGSQVETGGRVEWAEWLRRNETEKEADRAFVRRLVCAGW